MKYDFDTIINRRHTNAMKWNVEEDVLPMWVADMDFKTAPCVIEAMQKKSELGVYGYHETSDAYFESYQMWWKKYHGYEMKKEWMIFSTGVVPAISSIIRKLTSPAEKVCIQAPVYNIFYNSILNNGREVISSDLVYEDSTYHIDFDDLEEKLSDSQTTLFILCNPHNPIGMIWDKEVLAKIGALCHKHHVLLISDEIHCDIVKPGTAYIPFASVNEQCAQLSMTCISASKAFNLAGLQSACVVVSNPILRHKVWRALNTDEIAEPNAFANEATITAFQDGRKWLEALCVYIQENKEIAQTYIEEQIPMLHYRASDATYLLWIDGMEIGNFSDQLCTFLKENNNLFITSGAAFGKNGASFIRMNVACPREIMMEGLQRLKIGTKQFLESFTNI